MKYFIKGLLKIVLFIPLMLLIIPTALVDVILLVGGKQGNYLTWYLLDYLFGDKTEI